jgi:arylformamidase
MKTLYRNFETQAQIDAQYNPAIHLADAAAPGKHYAAQAALARRRLQCELDVAYGPSLAETLDIFPAETAGCTGVCVFAWRLLASLVQQGFQWCCPGFAATRDHHGGG